MNLNSVGIILLNWQNWPDTVACLESLRSLVYPGPIGLIVCDNASQDDSEAQILQWARQHYTSSEIGLFEVKPGLPFPEVQSAALSPPFVFIQTGANLGFAGGNNVGIRYALACQQFDYLWLLNNDTITDPCALLNLCNCAAQFPDMALFGSTLIEYYQRDTVQCAGGCRYFPKLTIFRQVYQGLTVAEVMQQNEKDITLDYVSGAAMFLRTVAVQKVGLLNEEYFLFYEELDYTQRLKRHGYQIGWCKDSLVYHKGSATVGSKREGNRDKLTRANYYENLSTLKYTANFYPGLLPWVMVIRFVLKALAVMSRGEFYLVRPLVRAYRDFIRTRKNE